MSILIKGVEMPTCRPLLVSIHSDGTVEVHEVNRYGWQTLQNAAVPVPPHGRLGDLDRLERMFVEIDNAPYSGFDGTEPFYSAENAAQIIRLAPTIIEAEGGCL